MVDGPIDKDIMRTDVWNLLSTSTQCPFERVPRAAHDLVGVENNLIAEIVANAQDEFLKLATIGAPLWINSPVQI